MPNARIQSDGAYVGGATLSAAWWIALDLAQFQAVNGDAGGTWAPSSPIEFTGASLWLCGPSTFVTVGGITNRIGTGARIQHGDNDWIETPTNGTVAVVTSTSQGRDSSFVNAGISGLSAARMVYESTADGVLSAPSNTNFTGGSRLILPLDVRHGATLGQVSVFFTVSAHTSVPVNLPSVRVIQVDAFGNVTVINAAANALLANWVGNGFLAFTPTPASGSAWHDGGGLQSIVYPCNNVATIDTTQFCYFVEIVDESDPANAVSGNEYLAAQGVFTVPDLRPY